MPYTMKLVDQELTTIANVGLRFITESSVARLRESDWRWPELSVEFKAGEREVESATEVNPEMRRAVEAEAAATLAASKVRGKKGGVAALPTVAEGEEAGAAEVVAAASTGGAGAKTVGPEPVRFSSKLQNQYSGFTVDAMAPFRINGKQLPGPDGTVYPEYGVEANGSLNPAKQTWPSVEHYFQAMKFPQDPAWQEEIRQAPTAMRARRMGQSGEHPVRGDWAAIREKIMKAGMLEKFRQNPGLLALLQGTGDREIQETSADAFWGVGTKGAGQNRMGKIIMEVRDELKDVRVDTMMSAAAAAPAMMPVEGGAAAAAATAGEGPESMVQEAKDLVSAATSGVVQMMGVGEESETVPAVAVGETAAAPAAAPAPAVQQGGVYMFINPQVGGVEPKAHRARSNRYRGSLAWEGMPAQAQEGGGVAGDQMTTDGPGAGPGVEVKVEKLG
jgi:ribA/ribD-fused uncharacterized protein